MSRNPLAFRSQRKVFLVVLGGAALCVLLAPVLYFGSAPLRYSSAIRSGAADLVIPRQMVAIWPNTSHQITYFTQVYGRPVWQSRLWLCDDRMAYELVYEARVRISLTGMSVRTTERGEIYLFEHLLVEDASSGGLVPSNSATMRRLDFGAWEAFVRSGGKDLSTLGMSDCVPCP